MVDQSTQTPAWPDADHMSDQRKPYKANNIAKTKATGFRLLDLPLELRRMVYQHVLSAEEDHSGEVPALLRCSLQICREATDVSARVITIQLYNGVCGFSDDKRQMIARAAARVKAACGGHGGPEVRIELMCHCGSLSVDWQLAPLLQVIRTTPMPKVEVHMTKSKTCRLCRRLMSYRDDPVDDVRSMVERAETWRDTGAMKVGIHPR